MHMGLKTALAAAAILTAGGLGATTASAMPMAGLTPAIYDGGVHVDQVRYVCNPWGCRWAPNRWRGPHYRRHYGWRRW